MHTIVDRKTLIVSATGLTREKATENVKKYMFLHTDSYKNAPRVHCSKLNISESRFDDITFEEMKNERLKLLNDSDWRDLPSYPGNDKAAWATYRQALRDLPQDYPDMVGLEFPVEPS